MIVHVGSQSLFLHSLFFVLAYMSIPAGIMGVVTTLWKLVTMVMVILRHPFVVEMRQAQEPISR